MNQGHFVDGRLTGSYPASTTGLVPGSRLVFTIQVDSSDALSFIVVKLHFEIQKRKLPAVRARSSRPCQSAAEILFANTLQAKMKSATRVVTGSSRQTSHAGGMEAALTRRDLCRARAISNCCLLARSDDI
jgi:hypothetical protein